MRVLCEDGPFANTFVDEAEIAGVKLARWKRLPVVGFRPLPGGTYPEGTGEAEVVEYRIRREPCELIHEWDPLLRRRLNYLGPPASWSVSRAHLHARVA